MKKSTPNLWDTSNERKFKDKFADACMQLKSPENNLKKLASNVSGLPIFQEVDNVSSVSDDFQSEEQSLPHQL